MIDFISLFAPHLTPELTREAAALESQGEIDALFTDITLPTRGGCGHEDG
jgi:LysR family cys regulon transcriptional activator